MQAICGYLLINQDVRRFEIISIIVVGFGIINLFQPDIEKIKQFFFLIQGKNRIEELEKNLDIFTFGLVVGFLGSLFKGLHLVSVTTIIEHKPY
jgi:hypothetical protein